jgi:hypothetical protein
MAWAARVLECALCDKWKSLPVTIDKESLSQQICWIERVPVLDLLWRVHDYGYAAVGTGKPC